MTKFVFPLATKHNLQSRSAWELYGNPKDPYNMSETLGVLELPTHETRPTLAQKRRRFVVPSVGGKRREDGE